MNTLQQIIKEMKADFSRDKAELSNDKYSPNKQRLIYIEGRSDSLEKYIPKLELLLSEGATEGGDKDGKADSSPMAQMPCSRTSRPTR